MKKYLPLSLLLLPVIYVGYSYYQQAPVKTAKAMVVAQFKDPQSAIFSEVKVYQVVPEMTNVCGKVNGKNNFGAYTGATRFIAFLARPEPRAILEDNMDPELFNSSYKIFCKEYF